MDFIELLGPTFLSLTLSGFWGHLDRQPGVPMCTEQGESLWMAEDLPVAVTLRRKLCGMMPLLSLVISRVSLPITYSRNS